MPGAPFHYACDGKWWDRYYDEVKAGFKGVSYTMNDADSNRNPASKYDLNRVDSCFGAGLGVNTLHYGLSGGGNSGYQAINLAYILGAKTIILLGFDMFGTHYFGKHPVGLDVCSPFKEFMKSYATIGDQVEVINCTRQTALTCFPKMNLESALSLVQGQASRPNS